MIIIQVVPSLNYKMVDKEPAHLLFAMNLLQLGVKMAVLMGRWIGEYIHNIFIDNPPVQV